MESRYSTVRSMTALAALAGVACGLGSSNAAFAAIKKNISRNEHVPGEVLVRVRDGFAAQSAVVSGLARSLGEGAVLAVNPLLTDKGILKVRLSDDKNLQAALARLNSEPSVEYAEPNYRVYAFDDGLPDDPGFSKTWGLKNSGQADAAGQMGTVGSDINIVPLWKEGFKGSRKVVVAVIDTGIEWTHPDLKDNLFTNLAEAGDNENNGKDNDGNGFINDIHGWNFANNTKNSNDDHSHGTHCAGTIGGVGNNGVGVAGVNWEVTLMPVKFLDAQGSGSLEGAVNSINYARMMKVNVMSNSWGGGGYTETLLQAIKAAKDAGIAFIAAAGNETNNNDSNPTYPAAYQVDNVTAVAATDNQDKLASFSNFGAKSVHVAAPGVKVYSTVKGGTYDTFSGTSMATPHVAGITALLMAAHPEWSYAEVKNRLITTSDPVAGLKKKVLAKGRVNAYNAMYGIVPPSNEPDPSAWKDFAAAVESDHPYKNSANQTFTVTVPGAKLIRVHFVKVDVEARFDHVMIETPAGAVGEDISAALQDYTSEYIAGDTVVIRLKSDGSVNGFGFKVDKVQYIPQ